MKELLRVPIAFGLTQALARAGWSGAVRTPALYAIGIRANDWSWQRVSAVGGL